MKWLWCDHQKLKYTFKLTKFVAYWKGIEVLCTTEASIIRYSNTKHIVFLLRLSKCNVCDLTEGGNLCQRQYKALANIYDTSCDPLTIFSGRPSLLSCPSQPSFVGMLISPIGPKAAWLLPVDHIQLLAITVCKFPSQIEVAIMPINFRPVIFENIVWF